MISTPSILNYHIFCDPYPEISSAARAFWVQTVQENDRLSKTANRGQFVGIPELLGVRPRQRERYWRMES